MGDLRGRSGRRFVVLLTGHVDATLEGARLAVRATMGEVAPDDAWIAMTDVEHRGDDFRSELVRLLSTTIITPIDREDMYRISTSIDDVLDNLRDFMRECDLFVVLERHRLTPVLEAITLATEALRSAIEVIAVRPQEITRRAVIAKRAGNEIRRQYELQLAELFVGEVTMEVLKQRELLRRLDVVGLRLGEAANALSDAAVKRSEG